MKLSCELTHEKIIYSELRVKEYKSLIKSIYGEIPDKLLFLENLCEILSNCSNKSTDYFKKLNLIDLICFLFEIRMNSHGDECKIHFKEDDKTTISLRLDHAKTELMFANRQISSSVNFEGIDIVFECPSIQRLLEPVNDEYLYFMKGAYITKQNKKHFLQINTNEQARLLFDSVSPKVGLQIVSYFDQIVDIITNTNFLERYGFYEQKLVFVPSIDNLIWFVKLIFSEGLDHFYNNIFHLSHLGHMSAEYIENCAVGEYNYFVGCLKRTLAKQNSPEDDNSEPNYSDQTDGFSEE